MKKFIGLFCALALTLSLAACAPANAPETTDASAETKTETEITNLIDQSVTVIEAADWNEEAALALDRTGWLCVVHEAGTVMDTNGNGTTTEGYYISYAGLNYAPGTVVDTYLMLNPDTRYWDDFIMRWNVERRT